MKKKILIGSIIAVAILVGVSFTSVVGYQSVESNLKESPLFNIRRGRAIEKDSNHITCDYIGKGTDTNINIPIRDNKQLTVQKFIELVCSMDDDSYNKFSVQLVSLLKKQDVDNIDATIYLIKSMRNNKRNVNLDNNLNNGNHTWFVNFSPTHCWFPLKNILTLIGAVIFLSILFIGALILYSTMPTCDAVGCPG